MEYFNSLSININWSKIYKMKFILKFQTFNKIFLIIILIKILKSKFKFYIYLLIYIYQIEK
jgi:hypothetical protein